MPRDEVKDLGGLVATAAVAEDSAARAALCGEQYGRPEPPHDQPIQSDVLTSVWVGGWVDGTGWRSRRGAADSAAVVVVLASATMAPEVLLAAVARRLRAAQTLSADVAVLSEARRLCAVAHTRPGGPARRLDLRCVPFPA
jgi:hypothetical protein